MAFNNSSNFVINDSQFFDVRYVNDQSALLLRQCAIEATHESSTAEYAPKCKPGTRQQVIGDILTWAANIKSSTPILWFSGPAGGGKTCIQREVARLCKEKRTLAATYFFSTRVVGLDREKPFIATIAHQLTESVPGYKTLVEEKIKQHDGIFAKSLEMQLQLLILQPLAALLKTIPPGATPQIPRALVIDGLDECRKPDERKHLLRLIHTMATNLSFPFKVIIASRPEYDIRTAFDSPALKPVTTIVRLDEYDGSGDIHNYLCDEFWRIRDCHPSKSILPAQWPAEKDVEALVTNASSQFIFASTVVKYIDNPRQNPIAALKRVLACCEGEVSHPRNPFAELDALYHLVLHPPDVDITLLRRLLSVMLEHSILYNDFTGSSCNSADPSPADLDDFLFLEPSTTIIVFCDLHSVLNIPTLADCTYGPIKFYHRSLQDYLRSLSRSGDLYRSQLETSLDFVVMSCHHIKNFNTRPPSPTPFPWSAGMKISCMAWTASAKKAIEQQPSGTPLPEILLEFHPANLVRCRHSFGDGPGAIPNELWWLERLQIATHSDQCYPNRACLKLCRRIAYILRYRTQIVNMVNRIPHFGRSEKAEALGPQFDPFLFLPDEMPGDYTYRVALSEDDSGAMVEPHERTSTSAPETPPESSSASLDAVSSPRNQGSHRRTLSKIWHRLTGTTSS